MLLQDFLKPTKYASTALASLLLLDSVQAQAATGANSTQLSSGFPPCDALVSAGLSHLVRFPSDPLYPKLVNGTWTADAQRCPFCFAQPSSVSELSNVVTALAAAGNGAGDWHIAIRSGGHGADLQNSITNGVIIDLTYLNSTTYDPSTNVAGISTGTRWGAVYSTLQEQGVLVVGGRQSIVGVGGLLLGGGVGWHTPRYGFGCDSVKNFEVVLSNGSIVNANSSANSDLWKALKGGSSNFGIVSRFDMEAFPAHNVSIERRTIGGNYTNQFVQAMVGFTNLNCSFHNNAMASVISYDSTNGLGLTVNEINTMAEAELPAFDAYNAIPIISTSGRQNLSLADATAIGAPELTAGAQTTGAGAITIANNYDVARYTFQIHEGLIADLNSTLGNGNFSTILEFQPLPSYYNNISDSNGGNMLGLDRDPRNKLYFALGATLLTERAVQQLPQVYQKIALAVQNVTSYAKSIGADQEFIYLPYADATQDPLGSYGQENVQFMKSVAQMYDPQEFFQKRVNGGFKLDRVTKLMPQ